MNDNITEIVVIADRSGSMSHMIVEGRNAMNELIKDQRDVEGYANITVVMFDNLYEVHTDRQNIQSCGLIGNEYNARGMTALRDAIGRTINHITEGIAKTPENKRPGKVVVAILTDGHENASKEFTQEQIVAMIDEKKALGWEFSFMGANIDSFAVGGSMNISANNTMNFAATNDGIHQAYATYSSTLRSFRSGQQKDMTVQKAYTLDEDGVAVFDNDQDEASTTGDSA